MKKTGIIVGLIVLLGLGGIAGGYYYFVQRPNITVGDDVAQSVSREIPLKRS